MVKHQKEMNSQYVKLPIPAQGFPISDYLPRDFRFLISSYSNS